MSTPRWLPTSGTSLHQQRPDLGLTLNPEKERHLPRQFISSLLRITVVHEHLEKRYQNLLRWKQTIVKLRAGHHIEGKKGRRRIRRARIFHLDLHRSLVTLMVQKKSPMNGKNASAAY